MSPCRHILGSGGVHVSDKNLGDNAACPQCPMHTPPRPCDLLSGVVLTCSPHTPWVHLILCALPLASQPL